MDKNLYDQYTQILKQELIPALGCTEPIAVAFAAAKAREVLGELPEKVIISCSGNIVKNVKSVIVPTTTDMKGISAAAAVGIAGGDPDLELEVLSKVDEKSLSLAKDMLKNCSFEEKVLHTGIKLQVIVEVFSQDHRALVEIVHKHNGIVRIEKDGSVLLNKTYTKEEKSVIDYNILDLRDIYDYACNVDVSEIYSILLTQSHLNCAIAKEGLEHKYGAEIGRTLLEMYGKDNPEILAVASAAAGSDARMSGCELPVVINSGSGNQGITIAVAISTYADACGCSQEKLLRALALGNLVSIYQKSKIGRLSAYCGAINAASGAGAGIAYLKGMSYEDICRVVINCLGNVSGIVCDGAKPSCAAKISSGLQAAFLAIHMTEKGNEFKAGDGLIKEDIESTIDCIVKLAKDGMKETDKCILDLMVPGVDC